MIDLKVFFDAEYTLDGIVTLAIPTKCADADRGVNFFDDVVIERSK